MNPRDRDPLNESFLAAQAAATNKKEDKNTGEKGAVDEYSLKLRVRKYYDYDDLMSYSLAGTRLHCVPGERIDTRYVYPHNHSHYSGFWLPEGTENTKEQLEDKARNGDVVAMAALGNCYYESSNLPLAFRYFASADQASTSPAVANAIANSITRHPVERRRYHRLSIERGGLASIYALVTDTSDKDVGFIHAMIAISNYDYLRPVEKLTFPDIPFYNIKGAYFSNQAAEKRIIWKDPNSDHVKKFRTLFAKIKLGKTQNDKNAYTEILDIFKNYPKSQLEPLSKLLYGDTKGDVLLKEIQDLLEKDVDKLDAKEAEVGWGGLSKKYHIDYLVGTAKEFKQQRTEELAINNQDKEFITKLIAEINVELSSSEIKNNLELKNHLDKIWDPKNDEDKAAYKVLVDLLRTLSKAELGRISNIIYDDPDILFEQMRWALLEEIKITNLDIRERGVEETGAMQKICDRYHKDYFGKDPAVFISEKRGEFNNELDKQEKEFQAALAKHEEELGTCLKEIKSKAYSDIMTLQGLTPGIDVVLNDKQQQYLLDLLKKPLPASQKERETVLQLRAFTRVAKALGLITVNPEGRELDDKSDAQAVSTINKEQVLAVQEAIKAAKNEILQKKSKDDRCAIYLDFAIRAIQMIGAALTIVGAFAMIHSRINYGTHEFWSTERKAKVAAKKTFSKFKEDSKRLLENPPKKKQL